MDGVQWITDRGVRQVVESVLDTTRDRETFAWGVRQDFANAVAKKAG